MAWTNQSGALNQSHKDCNVPTVVGWPGCFVYKQRKHIWISQQMGMCWKAMGQLPGPKQGSTGPSLGRREIQVPRELGGKRTWTTPLRILAHIIDLNFSVLLLGSRIRFPGDMAWLTKCGSHAHPLAWSRHTDVLAGTTRTGRWCCSALSPTQPLVRARQADSVTSHAAGRRFSHYPYLISKAIPAQRR